MADYVNNKELMVEFQNYRKMMDEAASKGQQRPQLTEPIIKAIMMICNNLSYKPNFLNYTYKDEMVLDAIENCFKYVHNFNPEKYDNPFAYITGIAYRAFVRRIIRENKESYTKAKLMAAMAIDTYVTQEQDDSSEYINSYVEFMQNNLSEDNYFEKKAKKLKEKRKTLSNKSTLSEFIDYGTEKEYQ